MAKIEAVCSCPALYIHLTPAAANWPTIRSICFVLVPLLGLSPGFTFSHSTITPVLLYCSLLMDSFCANFSFKVPVQNSVSLILWTAIFWLKRNPATSHCLTDTEMWWTCFKLEITSGTLFTSVELMMIDNLSASSNETDKSG